MKLQNENNFTQTVLHKNKFTYYILYKCKTLLKMHHEIFKILIRGALFSSKGAKTLEKKRI